VDLENKGELEGKYEFLICINDVAYLKAEVVMHGKNIKTVEYAVEDYTTGEYNIKIEDKEINIEIHEFN
jgi:hypothetical protein